MKQASSINPSQSRLSHNVPKIKIDYDFDLKNRRGTNPFLSPAVTFNQRSQSNKNSKYNMKDMVARFKN